MAQLEIDILTLFPQMFSPLEESIVGRAQKNGFLKVRVWDIRDYTHDRHKTADDMSFGGGGGMIMKPEPIFETMDAVTRASPTPIDVVALMSPQGQTFDQQMAWELASKRRIALICGHYEGVDERVATHLATEEISIGDFVLTGGELPALVVTDAVARLIPGVLGQSDGAVMDSFSSGLLEHPHYTRPRVYRGMEVPDVLLSGDHERIRIWRRKEALRRTLKRRPELLERAALSEEDRTLLAQVQKEEAAKDETVW